MRKVVTRKRRRQPVYFLLRLAPSLTGTLPEFLNAFVFREILTRYPELVDNLLGVRESLFTVGPNAEQFPLMSGETVFALKAWDVEMLETGFCRFGRRSTFAYGKSPVPEFEIVGPAEGFTRGAFTRLHLDIHLSDEFFSEPRARLEQYLRAEYLPYNLRREDGRYRFDLPRKALKKKILFAGFFETRPDGFLASLDVGPKFSLTAFLHTFSEEYLSRHAQARVSAIEW